MRWEYQTTSLASRETCIRVKKEKLELDMEQRTGSKLVKVCIKAVYCHPAYLTYMQNISCEMPGWMNHKLESRSPNINNLRYADDTTLMAESERELKRLLMMVGKESEDVLRLNIQKKEDHGIQSHHFVTNR